MESKMGKYRVVIRRESEGKETLQLPDDFELLTVEGGFVRPLIGLTTMHHRPSERDVSVLIVNDPQQGTWGIALRPELDSGMVFTGCEIYEADVLGEFHLTRRD